MNVPPTSGPHHDSTRPGVNTTDAAGLADGDALLDTDGDGDGDADGDGLTDGLTDGNTVKSKYTQLMLGWGTAAYVFENPVAHNTTVRLPAGLNTI